MRGKVTQHQKKKRILVVDDSSFQQKMTSGMLSEVYETLRASSGEEALQIYEREHPDMILTDLVMPGMTGLELQQALTERYGKQVVPIMFITASASEEDESRSFEGGAMDYIRKPFTKEHLLWRVGSIIRQMERYEELKTVAEKDAMTGLFNKATAQRVLEDICRRDSGTLMMVDLDNFKPVNDIYGHGMGDMVLIRFAEILRSVIRTSDIAGRMGGDEFILFCRDVKGEELVAQKAETINRLLLAAAIELMGADMGIPLGASIGAVNVPEEGRDYSELFMKADKALYEVKQNGKHGSAVYHGAGVSRQEEEEETATTISNARKILNERNPHKGAYKLGIESFKTVYRFQMRCLENYHRSMALALFTLEGDGATEAATDAFGEVLKRSLRRSDVYTKNGKSRYMALLTEIVEEDTAIILERIMQNWKKDEHGACEIAYELEMIRDGK